MATNSEAVLPLEQLRQIRIDKIKKLKLLGLDPYPQPILKRDYINEILKKGEAENVVAVGRILAVRGHGKLFFIDIKDFTGKIQIVLKVDETEAASIALAELLDIGDFIKVDGKTYLTKAGEFSILAVNINLLSKSLRPLPNKIDGFKDKEEKYRQRYADMITDEKTFSTLVKRSQIVQLFRTFFLENGFYEVNTPILQEVYGGANAKPFTTHHNALDVDFYLRISPELFLKRLIVGGFEKVFEFTINFRNEGIDRWHNPEFQNIEFYWAYSDYNEMMDFTEEMFKSVVKSLNGDLTLKYGDDTVDFSEKFPRVTFRDVLIEHTGIDFEKYKTEEKLREVIKEKKLLNPKDLVTIGYSNLLDVLYKRNARSKLMGPMFVIDYPAEMIALAKKKSNEPSKIATFQLLILGEEYVKAYNELNDPIDQRERWEETEKEALSGQEEAERLDEDYIRALEYGMPPTAGWGLGLERTIALLTDNHSIKDSMFFPTLRPENAKKPVHTNSDKYEISDEVKKDFPGISFAYIYINNVDIKKSDKDLENLKQKIIKEQSKLKLEDIPSIKPIKAYREIFKATKVDFHKCKPSPEALLRRVIQGKGIYNINTAVDAYNLAVLETKIGLGGFDADKLSEPVVLRYSSKGEKAHLIGDDTDTILRDNQIIYSDQNGPITIDLNYRDIDKTKITEKTKNIILFADGAPGLSKSEIEKALEMGAKNIMKYAGGALGEINYVE